MGIWKSQPKPMYFGRAQVTGFLLRTTWEHEFPWNSHGIPEAHVIISCSCPKTWARPFRSCAPDYLVLRWDRIENTLDLLKIAMLLLVFFNFFSDVATSRVQLRWVKCRARTRSETKKHDSTMLFGCLKWRWGCINTYMHLFVSFSLGLWVLANGQAELCGAV